MNNIIGWGKNKAFEAASRTRLSIMPPRVSKTVNTQSVYFRDGKRKIDAVLVYNGSTTSEHRNIFIKNLRRNDLDLEEEESIHERHRMFIKVHASDKVLELNAKLHGIPVKYEQRTVLKEDTVPKCLRTILNDPNPDPNDPVARRAWPTISKEQPTKYTNCERSAIVFKIMDYIEFGTNEEQFKVGIYQLLLKGDFIAAYALHDGPWKWPEDPNAPLNDRQLLAKYWANYAAFYKQQPLTTVETYFGPEIGMYFGWLAFYNQMLIVAAIVGVATYLYGLINIFLIHSNSVETVCNSDKILCPYCRTCAGKTLGSFCTYYYIALLNDNIASVLFAMFMSFWATSFMELWKRRQSHLILKWNLDTAIEDVKRPEFQAKAKHVHTHPYTGELEQYIPFRERAVQYSCSVFTIAFMIFVVVTVLCLIILYECTLKKMGITKMYISFSSAVMHCIIMMVFRKVYGKIAWKLTLAECPRTQMEFTKSFMLKMIVFSFFNSYGKMLYVAFFKGKFYTYPGDPKIRSSILPVSAEVCDPTGCIFEVFTFLATCVVAKPIFSNCLEILQPILKMWVAKKRGKACLIPESALPTWENDFELNASSQLDIMGEVEEMVIQYGFVTLLVAAFPLAPLMALINNIFEVRIDSSKEIKYFRRSQSIVATTMDVWFDTLQTLTYIAIITNALYLTFTSTFIPSVVYYFNYGRDMSRFFLFILSTFKENNNYWTYNITECVYVGFRYGPEEENAYQYTFTHYYVMCYRLGFAMIFMIMILAVTGAVAYAIPDIPRGIQDLIAYNSRKERRKTTGR